ncbi:MAG: hypothetical protein AABZ28_03105 [Nitrospinota bacterium]
MFDNLKQPEDMFAQTDKEAPHVQPPTATEVSTPSSVSEPVVSEQPLQRPSLSPEEMQQRVATMQSEQTSGGGLKVAIVILAVLVVVGAAFFISWRILTSRTPVTPPSPLVPDSTTEPTTPNQSETIVPEQVPESIPDSTVDTDQDGLTDEVELQLGTDINSADSDTDGLFDREEVDVYLTDPLNPDTDGDTFADGMEVEGGYDPNGPGKLLQIPSGS